MWTGTVSVDKFAPLTLDTRGGCSLILPDVGADICCLTPEVVERMDDGDDDDGNTLAQSAHSDLWTPCSDAVDDDGEDVNSDETDEDDSVGGGVAGDDMRPVDVRTAQPGRGGSADNVGVDVVPFEIVSSHSCPALVTRASSPPVTQINLFLVYVFNFSLYYNIIHLF